MNSSGSSAFNKRGKIISQIQLSYEKWQSYERRGSTSWETNYYVFPREREIGHLGIPAVTKRGLFLHHVFPEPTLHMLLLPRPKEGTSDNDDVALLDVCGNKLPMTCFHRTGEHLVRGTLLTMTLSNPSIPQFMLTMTFQSVDSAVHRCLLGTYTLMTTMERTTSLEYSSCLLNNDIINVASVLLLSVVIHYYYTIRRLSPSSSSL